MSATAPLLPPPSTSAWTLPARFGKYTLVRRMATGGMAELYLAIMRGMASFEKVVVIKRILPQMTQDPEFVEMLLTEARIAATLSHPNIAQTFDVGQHGGTYFIAMEHVHGDDIRGIVRQMKKKGHREFPLEHAIEIIIGVCKGLSYAHEKRDFDGTPLEIVHRDISPQNVVVAFSGDAKIVDFGIAKSHSKVKFRRSEDTETGKIKGKIAYMSPEQALGQDVDTRSDVFAAGILLYELTTGRRLFRAPSDYETLKLICERDVPRPSEVRPGYSPELERIVLKALTRKKTDRYQTAREMQADLEAFARRHQIDASSGTLSAFLHELYAGEPLLEHDVVLDPNELAQVMQSRSAAESEPEPDSGALRTPSTPAAAHTIPEATSLPARRSRRILALGAAIGIAAAALVVVGTRRTESAQTTSSAAAAPVRAALEITSDPPGGTIWIDGDLRTERTPALLEGLPVDREINVKVTHDGYEPFIERRSLVAGDQSMAATLVRGRLVARITVRPLDARLTLDGAAVPQGVKQLSAGQGELTLENLSTGEPHELLVEAPGFHSKRVSFSGAAFETKDLSVELDAEAPALAANAAKSKPGTAAAIPATAAAATPKGKGKLNVGASGGWCNVSVDGQAKGATPLAGLELPAGNHSVTCVSPEGKSQTSQVAVQPDGVARVKFSL